MQRFDDRIREFIFPERVVKTYGDVSGELYNDELRQVTFDSPSEMTLKNIGAGVLIDFGREIHGSVLIETISVDNEKMSANARLSLGESIGEALSHIGEKGATNNHAVRDSQIVLTMLSTQEYYVTGFRFAFLELLEDVTVKLKSIQAILIREPYERIGSFECSDKLLNKIYDTAAYTVELCLQNQLWDGIKRDRLVWIGDMAPEMKAIKYLYGYVPQIESGLDIATDSSTGWANTLPTYSLWWLIDTYEWCFYTDDYTFISEHKQFISELVCRIIENTDERGIFVGDFIDWSSNANDEKTVRIRKNTIRAVETEALKAAIKMLELFNDKALIEKCNETIKTIKDGMEDIDTDKYRTLAALIELADMGSDKTKATLARKGVKNFSTFMSYYILSAMAKNNIPALKSLKTYYGGMLDMGATTFWEDFDIDWAKNACRIDEIPDGTKKDVHGDNGDYCYVGYRHSLCHGWSSGPVPFLTEYVLGIRLDENDSKTVILSPHLEDLTYANGSIATPYGKISVRYKKVNGKISCAICAPDGIKIIRKF